MKGSLLIIAIIVAIMNLVVPIELNFIIISGILSLVIVIEKSSIYKSSFLIILPFLLLILIGTILGMYNADRDFYRDVFIFSKVIIYFLGGLAASKYLKNTSTFFKYFSIISLFSALVHISTFAMYINSVKSLETIRQVAGYGNEMEAITFSIFASGILNKSFKILIKDIGIAYKIIVLIIGISFLLYFSRTLIVTFLIVLLFLTDVIYVRKLFSKKNLSLFKFGFSMITFCCLIIFIASQSSTSPFTRLVEKFERIPDEVTWNAEKNRTATLEDINNNWRGYEAYQGLLKFNKGNYFQNIFGNGFGEKVDLGISMKLAGNYYEQVPILHNAYVSLLVKSGFVGIICYLVFFYELGFSKVRKQDSKDLEIYYLYQMLSGLCVATLLNTFTMRGLLSTDTATIPILLGLLWGIIERRKQTVKSDKIHTGFEVGERL